MTRTTRKTWRKLAREARREFERNHGRPPTAVEFHDVTNVPTHPLWDYYEHDYGIAARRWNVEQARHLLMMTQVTVEGRETGANLRDCMAVGMRNGSTRVQYHYESEELIRKNAEHRQEVSDRLYTQVVGCVRRARQLRLGKEARWAAVFKVITE